MNEKYRQDLVEILNQMPNPSLSLVFQERPADFYNVASSYIENEIKGLGIEPNDENKTKLAHLIRLFGCLVITDKEKVFFEPNDRRKYLWSLLGDILNKV